MTNFHRAALVFAALIATPGLALAQAAHDAHAHEHAAPVAGVESATGHDGHDHGSLAAVTLGQLEISGGFSRATLPNAPVGGGYVTIVNKGAEADRLVSASSPVAGVTQLHEMKMEGDVMKMNELPQGIEIPAGGTVTLAPGGLHIMFMELRQPLVEGTRVPVTLTFEKAGSIEVEFTVEGAAAKEPASHVHGEAVLPALATGRMA